ncbi:MAG TPA: hypothetical protein VK826_03665, partial [Bacteroidia bacterium]|nr:hypothetical protein [Bacteroidia bacterium]
MSAKKKVNSPGKKKPAAKKSVPVKKPAAKKTIVKTKSKPVARVAKNFAGAAKPFGKITGKLTDPTDDPIGPTGA